MYPRTAVDRPEVELRVLQRDLGGGHAEQRHAVVADGGLLVVEVRLGVEVLDLFWGGRGSVCRYVVKTGVG